MQDLSHGKSIAATRFRFLGIVRNAIGVLRAGQKAASNGRLAIGACAARQPRELVATFG
jgi:hypothetical protein